MKILTLIKNRHRKDISIKNYGSVMAILEDTPIVMDGSEINANRAYYLLNKDGYIDADDFYIGIGELIQKKHKNS